MTVYGCLIVGLVIAFSRASSAGAQESDADALIREGIELRKLDRNADALVAFQRAFQQQPSTRVQAQIALAHQALGEWIAAEAELVEVLAQSIDAWIERNRAPLEVALEKIRDHLGSLEIECDIVGARVSVNGTPVGSTPLFAPLRVVAGTVRIELQADPQIRVERHIEVPAHGVAKAAIVFVTPANASKRVGALDPTIHAPLPDTGPRAGSEPRDQPETLKMESATRRVAWIGLTTAGVALATALTAHAIREQSTAHYNDDTKCFFGAETRDERCGSYRSTANAAQVVALLGYAVAGSLLGMSVVLLITTSSPARLLPGATGRANGHITFSARF